MTLDQAVHLLRGRGCTVIKSEGREVTILDPNDQHLRLTDDPERYSAVATHLFADKVKPYPIDEDTRHVFGECTIWHDATEMAAALDMVSECDEEFFTIIEGDLHIADEPSHLWVRRRDGGLTTINEDRLHALQKGAAAQTEVEQMLIDNPEWLNIYLQYVFGTFKRIVMLKEGEPLPKWDPDWLEDKRNPPMPTEELFEFVTKNGAAIARRLVKHVHGRLHREAQMPQRRANGIARSAFHLSLEERDRAAAKRQRR